jgi:hypothetical protein
LELAWCTEGRRGYVAVSLHHSRRINKRPLLVSTSIFCV